MIPADSLTAIHLIVFVNDPATDQSTDQSIDQLEGAKPNEVHGAVTPVRYKHGDQRFACDKADMKLHAGKMYEGVMHSGTDDVQFVRCPFCEETEAYKERKADHDKHTVANKGLFAQAFNKQRASQQGRAQRPVEPAKASNEPAKATAVSEVLPSGKGHAEPASTS